MIKENKWYIESSNPDNFVQPKCFACGDKIDCITETPCETHILKKVSLKLTKQ